MLKTYPISVFKPQEMRMRERYLIVNPQYTNEFLASHQIFPKSTKLLIIFRIFWWAQ